jgi:carboxylesterase
MGSVLALNLAIEKPQWVDGLGLYGSTFFYDGWTIPRVARLSFLLPLVCGMGLFKQRRFMESFPYGIKDERVRMRIAAAAERGRSAAADRPRSRVPPRARRHNLIWHVRPRLQEVRAPALIMHAADDDIASVRNARLIERRITGATETVLLNDSYHMITVDGERDKVIARSADFFTRILANSPMRTSRPRIATAAITAA